MLKCQVAYELIVSGEIAHLHNSAYRFTVLASLCILKMERSSEGISRECLPVVLFLVFRLPFLLHIASWLCGRDSGLFSWVDCCRPVLPLLLTTFYGYSCQGILEVDQWLQLKDFEIMFEAKYFESASQLVFMLGKQGSE